MVEAAVAEARRQGLWGDAWQRLKRSRAAIVAASLLLLVLGGTVLFSRNISGQLASASLATRNAAALADAKEALLGYIVTRDATHPGKYGFLPCPDIDATGSTAEGRDDRPQSLTG